MFRKYPKLRRLNSTETNGILNGKCYVQEKVDGANVSIWQEDGEVKIASRRRQIKPDESFNGFREYVADHEGIQQALKDDPSIRLYGEWLVPHTIRYDEASYQQFYLFDIFDHSTEKYASMEGVYAFAEKYNIKTPELFAVFNNPDEAQIFEFAGKSVLGEKGEGVVIKNVDFINEFSDCVYAKIVTKDFREKNLQVFGGNSKQSPNYWERYVCNKYITPARVRKIKHKIEDAVGEEIGIENTKRVIHTVYHDMLTEEIWEIQKKVQRLNFHILRKIACKKAATLYMDILNNFNSVAHEENNNA